MDPAMLDIQGLIVNAPLAGVVFYLFNEVQKLHKERADFMAKQLELFQKVALKVGASDD